MTCKDCIYRAMCYNHEHYGRDDEETCEMFKNKADFVEVVRCKDCDVPHNKWLGCSNLKGLIPPPDFYCAFGVKKGGTK